MKTLKTFALTLALAHGLALTAQAVTPTKRLTLDIGRPENTFVLGPISRGSTEYIDAALYVRGTAYPTNDLNGYIWYSETGTSTSGVKIANTSSANINGHVYFQVSTAQSLGLSTNASDYPATNYCAVVLTNATQTFSWDVGKLVLRWEPALAGAGLASTYPISAVIPGEYITNIVDGAYIEATRSGRDVTLSVTGLTAGAGGSVDTNTIAERAWVEGKNYLTSYTETDPVWTANSGSYLRKDGGTMVGNINLNAYTITNGVINADQLIEGTVPLDTLDGVTTNQMAAATVAQIHAAASETDPVWVAASNSFARTSGFQMLGNINLNAFTLDNGIVDADQLTTGTVPLSALSSITTNQMQGAAHALYVADTDTDTTYTAGTGIALAGGEFSASGVSTNEMAAATVAQIHASGGASALGDLSDVADLSGAAADEVLTYNGATWTNAAASGADVAQHAVAEHAQSWLSANVSIAAESWTNIGTDNDRYDSKNIHSGGAITFTSTGVVQVCWSMRFTGVANSKYTMSRLTLNGNDHTRGTLTESAGNAAGYARSCGHAYAYNDASTNVWRVQAYNNDSDGGTEYLSGSATALHTQISALRFKNQGE